MNTNLRIIEMDSIESKEVDWLWYPYIPFGKVTIIQGDPGEGKTTFALWLASQLSNGKKLDDDTTENQNPLHIIYQTAEDGLADTVKPRLEKFHADCSKISVIDESTQSLSMSDERIEQAINEKKAKLLILDPIQAYLGADVDMHRANEVRYATKNLTHVAERTGCAIVLIGHMNKSSSAKAAYKGMGSIDFFAVVRSVLLVARTPDNANIRAVAQIKNNLAPEGKTIAFRLDESGFLYIGGYEITTDELINGYSLGGTKSKQIAEVIQEMLESGKPVPSDDIFAACKQYGSDRTI